MLWDGLPAHRGRAMRDWLNTQRRWLVVERLPAYALELNPVEGLWSWLKGTQLANLICLLVPSPDWALGLMTRQINTQNPLRSVIVV